MLNAIWNYRYFIVTSVQADFRNRVARSRLGLLWLILAPLAQIVTYAFVLSSVMAQRLPGIESPFAYAIYLMAGFQGWLLFVEIVSRSMNVFIESGNVLKKIAFPRIALPLVVVISSIINNLIFFIVLLAVFTLAGFSMGSALIWLPLLILVNAALAAGLGVTLGVLNVFLRDIGQIVPIIIQFLFWMTPIVYVKDILPPAFQTVIKLNPLFWLIDNYHRVMVYDARPDLVVLSLLGLLAIVFLALGMTLFRKASAEMVDVL
ncbi:ABC transporter permease [Rhizobium sp. SSA_523]|uniref:ABC transporter permease n=1 Tax=Rhizobium sp. SSA_523 TaxID=2952477 RepID=UPI0020911508|nr:ABC transporter permease [Rhizobium sp. SSA_523]MCO5734711.1 ABC transporter permease [Rhizobium sp. SSA_523]WKC20963.1 ABC transporter permease [Rhizobium sp. SSA_523]